MSHQATAARMLDDRGYSGHLIRGQNPASLFESGVRNRVTASYYWQEQCFGLNAATLLDRAVDMRSVAGVVNERPSPFICLLFKMLQLDIEREVIDFYLLQSDFKYLACLAAAYIRMTEDKSETVYQRLEPLLQDSRKIRWRGNSGFRLSHVDEFVDALLHQPRVCSTSFFQLVPRNQLEEEDKLDERISPCQHLLDEELERRSESSVSSRRTRSPSADSRSRSRSRSKSVSRGPDHRRRSSSIGDRPKGYSHSGQSD